MATTEVTGLKLTVTSSIADTKRKLDAVKSSLSKLKIADSKVKAINDLAIGVSKFANAINKLDAGKINTFGTALKGLGEVEIKKSVINRVNELGEAFANVDVKNLGKSAERLNAALSPLAETMSKISSASKELGINANFGKAVARAEDAYEKVSKDISLKGAGKEQPEKEKSKAEQFRESAKGAAEQFDNIFNSTKIGQAYTALNNFRQAITILKEEFAKTNAGQFFMEIKQNAEKAFQAIKQGVQKAVAAFKKLVSMAGSIVSAISKIGFLNPFRGFAESVGKVITKLKTLSSSLMRIAMYRALRTAIKEISKAVREGLNNLYQWSKATGGDFAPAVDKLATAMLYLKNSFGAAVSPLITQFAPAIDIAVDKIVSLLNVVNQLFARLTGRATWTKALKYPTEFAESAAGATKKVKDNIQDFDELHILRTDNGGGGGDSMDYSKMFEETEFSEGLTDWIENLKDAIKAGRWYEAGNIIADELNSVINRINWGQLGTKLGNKINDMFSFAWGFLHNFDFVQVGTAIATFLNNAIDSIDTYQVGQVFAHKWSAIVDTLYGFITTFDWVAFGVKVSQFVEGWFDEIDGYKIAVTISEAIKGALDAAIAFLSNDSMLDKFAEDIAGLINGIDWYGILVRVLNLGTKIVSAIGDVISGALSGQSSGTQQQVSQSMDRVYASAPESIAQRVQNEWQSNNAGFGDRLITSMSNSIDNANSLPLSAALSRLFNSVLEAVWKVFKAFAEKVGIHIAESIDQAITGSHYDEHGNRVSDTSGQTFIENTSTSSEPTTARDVVENVSLTEILREGATDIVEFGSNFTIVGSVINAWSKNAQRDIGKVGRVTLKTNTDISKSYSNLSDNVNKSYVAQKNGFSDLRNVVINGSKGMTDAFDEFGDKMNGDVVNRVLQSKNTISATITSLADDTKFKMNDMSSSIYASIDNTDKAITTPLSNIKTQITTTFRDAGSDASTSIKGMGEIMNASLKGVVEASKGHLEGYNDLWSQLKGNVKGVSNSVIEGSEKMANGVTDAFNSILDNLNNFKITTPDGYKFDYNLKHLPRISIPKLATGGIATSPTTALIGEAGKEAVLPLENNTEWMNTLAERINGEGVDEVELLREQNDLLRQIAGKNVTISSREIFNAVRDENDEYVTRTGKSALAL